MGIVSNVHKTHIVVRVKYVLQTRALVATLHAQLAMVQEVAIA